MVSENNFLKAQFRALGYEEPPASVMVEGGKFWLREQIKHSFAVAVAVYESGDEKVVVKLHRRTCFFGIPLKWLGELMAGHENAVLKHCSGVAGVPRQRNTALKTAVAHDYIAGHSLRSYETVDDVFFRRLMHILDQIHERGVAYVDLEKPENILKGDDGDPYFIDFQVAFYWPDRLPPGDCSLIRGIRDCLQECDRYHAYKHLRRMRPDLLSERQYDNTMRKPWPVKMANALLTPWRLLRKVTHRIRPR